MTTTQEQIIETAVTEQPATVIHQVGRGGNLTITKPGVFCVLDAHSGWGSAYCARLTPGSAPHKAERSFLNWAYDQRSRAGNGPQAFRCADGIYEASGVARSYESTTEWFEVSGEIVSTFDNQLDALAALHGCTTEEVAASIRAEEAERLARREAETAAAQAAAEAEGLPKLTGSPKQITWAETIRAKALKAASEGADTSDTAPDGEVAALAWLKRQSEAKFWIDGREKSGLGWLGFALRRIAAKS